MEDEACEHIVTFLIRILSLFSLRYIELTEEVECKDGVDVANNGEKTHSEDQFLPIVCDSLQDDPESRYSYSYINQMRSKEEVVVVTQHRENKVEEKVDEGLK